MQHTGKLQGGDASNYYIDINCSIDEDLLARVDHDDGRSNERNKVRKVQADRLEPRRVVNKASRDGTKVFTNKKRAHGETRKHKLLSTTQRPPRPSTLIANQSATKENYSTRRVGENVRAL